MTFTDDYPQKASKLLDKEIPGGNENAPQLGTSVVLVMKQEPQELVMPPKAAVQNQQDVSVAVREV